MVAELYKYTPALDKPENLQRLLVGRESLLKRLLQAIHDGGKSQTLQHFLFVGPRGIGKTHLLLLLYYSVKETINWDKSLEGLHKDWEPILFSEEQYGLGSLTDLLIEVLERLNEQASDERLARLLARMKDVWMPGEKERTAILDYLTARRSQTGKRLLLLLDNLQLILHNFSEEDQSRLRGILMSKDLFMIVGSAPTLFDAVLNYEAPFYNFFEIIWLKEMSFEEVEALLKKRLELDNHTDIIKNFDEYRPRIRAIVHLTDGNPRLILSLYQILSQGEVLEVERALLRLLDELTPYFQDRMNGLSEQQRKIIEAMALMEGLSTPTEIAHAARLGVNVVTSQLRRLEKLGYVRRQRRKAKRESLYDISEQLFRLWRQMRVEVGRRRLHFIVTFLKIWFTEQELTEFSMKTVQEMSTWLGLSLENALEGNEKQALEDYQRALDCLSHAPLDSVHDDLILYFKSLFQAKATGLAEKALDLIEAKGADWAELLRPYREALRYLKTKDGTILDRLFPEIRQIVEQMVAQVEGVDSHQP